MSLPYVHLTASVMAAFGAEVDIAEQQIVVPAGRYDGDDIRCRTGRLVGELSVGDRRRPRWIGHRCRPHDRFGAG